MMSIYIRLGAILSALAVILGALGAHGSVHDTLIANGTLSYWQTAVLYHLVHGVALFAVAVGSKSCTRRHAIAWITMATGMLVFCGSLYILALTGMKGLGAIIPIGGALMIGGWVLFATVKWGDHA